MLRQIYAVCTPAAPAQPETRPKTGLPPVLPGNLLIRARELDAEHRAAIGRPISRDTLRAQLRIGRDRASALVATIRAESAAAAEAEPAPLRAA